MGLDEVGRDRVRFRLDRLDAIINRNAILRRRFFVRDRGHGCTFGIRGVAMLTAIVVLHLVVHDCDTGTLLYEARQVMPSYANSIEACRRTGVEKARSLATKYRKAYPNASANVDCEWRRGAPPTEPA
jgi:hypothetical protein